MGPKPKLAPATYIDLEQVPEHQVGELIAGEIIVSPRPAPAHANAASVIGTDLNGPFHRDRGGPRGPGGWWIFYEPELHLGGDALVPDVAGWRREHMPRPPSTAAFELVPDWVCEVLSPSTARIDRLRKLPVYAREHVNHVWLVDPIAKTIEVLGLESGRWVLLATHGEETDPVRIAPFVEIELDLTRWWLPD